MTRRSTGLDNYSTETVAGGALIGLGGFVLVRAS